MTGTVDPQLGPRAAAGEDPEVASLVRDVAGGWRMPPRRIGEATWRDRTGPGRSAGPRRRVPIAGAAAAGIAATIMVALGGAWLAGIGARPIVGPGASGSPAAAAPSASTGATESPGASSRPSSPAATPLPAYVSSGAPLAGVTTLALVDAAYRVIDMADGSLSDPLAQLDGSGSRVFALADGTFLCACATFGAGTDGTRLDLVLRHFDASGRPGPDLGGLTYKAVSGPPGGAPALSIEPTLSPGGRYVSVGWTAWDGGAWTSGIDVLAVGSGGVARGPQLPAVPGTATPGLTLPDRWSAYVGSGRPVAAWAPIVALSPDGTTAIVHRSLVVEGSLVLTEWWRVPVTGSSVGAPVPIEMATGAGGDQCVSGAVGFAGWTTPSVFAALCADDSATAFRRIDASGRRLGDVDVGAALGTARYLAEGSTVASPAGGLLYAWDPFARRLTAIDTVAGRVTSAQPIGSAASGGGPLDVLAGVARSLGRALVPSAFAKTYLDPSIAISPDGRRLYLLGTSSTAFESADGASLGVWVVDTASLAVVGTWTPTADLDSIAMSADGRLVLAAGASGVDTSGAAAPWEASVTAWDAETGIVRAVAGRLGNAFVALRRTEAR